MGDPVTLADFRAVQFSKRTMEAYETFYTNVLKNDKAFRANHEKVLASKVKPKELKIYMDKCYNFFMESLNVIMGKANGWIEGSNLL